MERLYIHDVAGLARHAIRTGLVTARTLDALTLGGAPGGFGAYAP